MASAGKNGRNIEALMRKVKELAERGVDGEQENARAILQRMIEQYGPIEVDTEKKAFRSFRYHDDLEARLLSQVIFAVTGESPYNVSIQRQLKKKGAYCTEREAIEIETQFAFYKNHLARDLDVFFSAFCNINNIFPIGNKAKDADELSGEQLIKAKRMFAMMRGMDPHTPVKLIEA